MGNMKSTSWTPKIGKLLKRIIILQEVCLLLFFYNMLIIKLLLQILLMRLLERPMLWSTYVVECGNNYKASGFFLTMEFIAFLGADKEGWGQITALVNRLEDCEKVLLVKDKNTLGFPKSEKCEFVNVDASVDLIKLKEDMMNGLRQALSKEFEVVVSLASGNGKEHMALVSALLNIPVGIRLAVYTREGVKFLT